MSGPFGGQIDFTFNAGNPTEDTTKAKQAWAQMLFGDPLALPPKLKPEWVLRDSHLEPSLYSDWQIRDTMLGFRLLEGRGGPLKAAIESYRNGLIKRQRNIPILRTKLNAAKKINASEPNPLLRHKPELFAAMEQEIAETIREFDYLQRFNGRMASLHEVLNRSTHSGEFNTLALPEHIFRLIGLGWKGDMKVRAFRARFPQARYALPSTPEAQTNSINILLPGNELLPAIDVTLAADTVDYLLHLITTITELAQESSKLFDATIRSQYLTENWPLPLVMIRAIVELFYFCSFEIGYTRSMIYCDRDNPEVCWYYQPETGQWQATNDELPGDRMKRQAADVVSLLSAPPPFLDCTSSEELSRFCRVAAQEMSQPTNQYQPYRAIGLARFEGDTRTHIYRFRNTVDYCVQLIEQLCQTQANLQERLMVSGSPVATLLSLARLEAPAFGLDSSVDISDDERFQLLGKFWRLLAKQRPLSLLGDAYAKKIYQGMLAQGALPPERSSLLSVHLSSVFAPSLFGKVGKADPIGALILGDQIRLIELINATWNFVQNRFQRLQNVHDLIALDKFFQQEMTMGDELSLAANFNNKWLQATQSIWSLIRAAAPSAWDFWTQIANRTPLQQELKDYDSIGAINYLLQVYSDLVRLMLLLESCSPTIAERLNTSAEDSGRELFAIFAPFIAFVDLSSGWSYYFDYAVMHDSWLSFVSMFRKHLTNLSENLSQDEKGQLLEMVDSAISRLDTQYPELTNLVATPVAAPEVEAEIEVQIEPISIQKPIDEVTANAIEKVCQKLIEANLFTPDRLPLMIALGGKGKTAADIITLAENIIPLCEAFSPRKRWLICTDASVIREVANSLRRSSATVITDTTVAVNATVLQEQLDEYLTRLDQFINYVDALIATTVIGEQPAHELLTRLAYSEQASQLHFSLVGVAGRVFTVLSNNGDGTVVRNIVTAFINERVDTSVGWQPEVTILGNGRLMGSNGSIRLLPSIESNASFNELNGSASRRILWFALRTRFETALQQIQHEIPGAHFEIGL